MADEGYGGVGGVRVPGVENGDHLEIRGLGGRA